MDEMNWLLMLPSITVFPPRSLPEMRTGGNPGSPANATSPPRAWSAPARGPTGRSSIRALPVSTTGCRARSAAEVRSRSVVPEFPQSTVTSPGVGKVPPQPATVISPGSHSSGTPRASSPRAVSSVSAARSGPSIRVLPEASAPAISARWV
jgi:hypothetical protein